MRGFILALGLGVALAASSVAMPAMAKTIEPAQARANIGQTVTVTGVVSAVHVSSRSGTVFIEMGGSFPHNAFTAVIFRRDAARFHDVRSLGGRTVEVTGAPRLYRGRPEIILTGADQLKRE